MRSKGTCTPERNKTQTAYIQTGDTYYKYEDAEEERRRRTTKDSISCCQRSVTHNTATQIKDTATHIVQIGEPTPEHRARSPRSKKLLLHQRAAPSC